VQGPNGQWTENVGLEGPLGGAQGEAANTLEQNLGTPLDTGEQARTNAVNAMYGSETAVLDPRMRQQKEASDATLANEGLSPTSEGARAQENAESQSENQAYAGARANAEQVGNEAQQITFGENVTQQQLPLQELSQMLGLEAQPGFQGAGVAQTPEYLAAAMGLGNYQLGANQQNNALLGSMGQGAGQLISGAMGAIPFGL
jgi:hypothetical protein